MGIAPVNPEEISLYDEAKTELSSLVEQTAQVFTGLLVMLLLTGGNPPGWVVTLSFFVGIGFVASSENKRLTLNPVKDLAGAILIPIP